MKTIAEQSAVNARLSTIMHEHSINPGEVEADSATLSRTLFPPKWTLSMTVVLQISDSDADFIRYNTSRKVASE